VPEVVTEGDRFRQVLVEAKAARDRPGDLRDFQCVSEARPVMIAFGEKQDLGLVFQPPEGFGVDDTVAVDLEAGAQGAWSLFPLPAFRL
jgi:hypothetical protein